MSDIELNVVKMNYDQFSDYMARVFAKHEEFMREDISPVRGREAVNRHGGETETRMLYREPNPAFVNFDWGKRPPVPETSVVRTVHIPRQPLKKKARDYHCGVATAFCDDLKETIRCQLGNDVDLSFFDADYSDDLFYKDL